MTITERIADLREYAGLDGISPNESSIADFLAFPSDITDLFGPYLFLLDNGNIRGLWKSKAQTRRFALEFLGEGRVALVIEGRGGREPFSFSLEGLPESLSEESFLAFLAPYLEGVRIS